MDTKQESKKSVSGDIEDLATVSPQAKDIITSSADTKNMDEANKKALDVLIKGAEKDFLKHVFTNQETGQPRSYAEMRIMYG